jgi:CRP-like cAMP-binding protein
MPLLEAHPELATRLLKILCGRLRKTSEQVEDIIFLDLPIRLAKAVLYLYRQAGSGAAGREIRITQRELSQMVGASREGTNRELRNWEQRKWLKLKRAGLVVLAPEALTRLIAAETQ